MIVLNCTHNVFLFPDCKKKTAPSTRGFKLQSKQVETHEIQSGPSINDKFSNKFAYFVEVTRRFLTHLFALIQNLVFVLGSPFYYERFVSLKCKF